MPEPRPDPDHESLFASQARHVVVSAPPGTGKTFLSVRMAGHLVADLPDEARVLLLTFSTQARSQLEKEAAKQLTPKIRARVEITNYHRFFWTAVGAYRRALGLPEYLDIGSRARRERALELSSPDSMARLRASEGLIDSLAEHAFPEFQDSRTPEAGELARLLQVVTHEQLAGRLVFDDLGALFWSLLERFPSVDAGYKSRYPVVIADEHQDASALQDAVVRRLASKRLIVFADPMQLIHQYRGASHDRLESHQADCDENLFLRTAHRWHENGELAEWLLNVRRRLQGETTNVTAPAHLSVKIASAAHGFNGMKPLVRFAIPQAFATGSKTVAVLARGNAEVAQLRNYLSGAGLHPRQVGSEDFEEARQDIEQLLLLRDPQSIALHALGRIESLVATMTSNVISQAKSRLGPTGINFQRANPSVATILRCLQPIYSTGPDRYFHCLNDAIESSLREGHHLARREAVGAIRNVVHAFGVDAPSLDKAIERYSLAVIEATNVAPKMDSGLFVMTVHQAKGKEFDCVIIADASTRYWRNDEDNRRLFYVALTRASKFWVIVAPDANATPLLTYIR